MIIVDTALKRREEERNPIHVAMTGAGNIGRALTLVIEKYITGMKLVSISNRTLANAEKAYRQAEVASINKVETVAQLENSIASGQYAITMTHRCFAKHRVSRPSSKQPARWNLVPMLHFKP